VKGSHFVALLSAMLIVGLVAGLTTSASAGASGTAVTAAKKKCSKKKKAASAKKKKCAKPVTPAPTPVPPVPPAPTTLAVTPTDFTFPTTEHGTQSDPQTFTVTNTGGAPSGVPTPSITETKNPIPGDPPGFVAGAGTCTAALPPGGTCAVSVRFTPTSNAGDAEYKAVLHVNASPGSDAQATLTGTAD
jgi:hypothetical protein